MSEVAQNQGQKKERAPRNNDKQRGENKEGETRQRRDERPRTQGDRPQRDGDRPRRQRREQDDKPRAKITLDTPVPQVPDKKDRLQKPSEEDYKKTMSDIDNKIDQQFKELKKFIEDSRKPKQDKQDNKKGDDKKTDGSSQNYQQKLQDSKQLNQEFKAIKASFNEKKQAIEENYNKQQKLKDKMKKNMTKEQIESELKSLKDLQSKGTISLQQEKVIINEIHVLEKSLPHAAPLDTLQKELGVLKKDKDALGKQMNQKWEVLQALNVDINLEKEQLDAIHGKRVENAEARTQERNAVQQAIDDKKAAVNAKVDELKNLKRTTRENFYDQTDKYEEQQYQIDQANFILKIKAQIQKDLDKKAEYEKKKKEREEEEKLFTDSPFQPEIDLLNLLVDYTQKLNPNYSSSQNKSSQPEAKQVDIEQALKSAEWKKDNCTQVEKKTEIDQNIGKKKKQFQQKAVVVTKLNHTVDVLAFFDKVKVAPPMLVTDIDTTVQLLKEKQAYYQNLPKDAKKQDESEKKTENNNNKRSKTNNKFDLNDNEGNFPGLG